MNGFFIIIFSPSLSFALLHCVFKMSLFTFLPLYWTPDTCLIDRRFCSASHQTFLTLQLMFHLLRLPVSNYCQIHKQTVASLNNAIVREKIWNTNLPLQTQSFMKGMLRLCRRHELSTCLQTAKVLWSLLVTHKLEKLIFHPDPGVDSSCW